MQKTHIFVCPVCGSTKYKIRYKIDKWDIEECASCGFSQIYPPSLSQTRAGCYSEKVVYERNTKQRSALKNFAKNAKHLFKRMFLRGKSSIFYNKLCKYLFPGAKVLDVGCGDGTFLDLAKNKFVCTGIEISDYLAVHARKKENIRVIEGDFQSTDFKDDKYGGITLIALLEHMSKPLEVLEKCLCLLDDNGALFLKTVNYGSLNRHITGAGWVGFRPPDHAVYFNPKNLRMALLKAGFRKIKVHALPFSDNMYCEAWK